jgi:hypothetical protein
LGWGIVIQFARLVWRNTLKVNTLNAVKIQAHLSVSSEGRYMTFTTKQITVLETQFVA